MANAFISALAPACVFSNRTLIHLWRGKWNIHSKKINIKLANDIHHKPFGVYAVTLSCAVDNRIVRLLLGYPITEVQYVFKDTQTFISFTYRGFVVHSSFRLFNFKIK